MTPPSFIADAARKDGPIARGCYRVVVLEGDTDCSARDFDSLDRAERYANDAASETDGPGGSPLAYIFDDQLRFLNEGRHYAAR
jgi:hypothetical protein